jgi:hypothetical protein
MLKKTKQRGGADSPSLDVLLRDHVRNDILGLGDWDNSEGYWNETHEYRHIVRIARAIEQLDFSMVKGSALHVRRNFKEDFAGYMYSALNEAIRLRGSRLLLNVSAMEKVVVNYTDYDWLYMNIEFGNNIRANLVFVP